MRLKSFSYALSRLSWEFHYPIFFYERSGSDFARIFCAVARHLVHQPPTDQGRDGVDSKTCSGSWLGTDAGINRLRNSGRARGSSNPSRRKAKRPSAFERACKTAHNAVATAATFSSAGLIAETNAEGACSANQIAIGTHGFQLADGVTDFDRAHLRSGERNHFSKLTGSN